MKKILVTLATLAVSAGFALAGSGQAQADPGLCWNGWLWSACVEGPGWVDWNPGWVDWNPGWGGCNPGHGCGDHRHGGKHLWK
jgi:hypothetical protein